MNLSYLYEFATERQLEVLKALEKKGSQRKAANHLGIAHSSVKKAFDACKKKAARAGIAPEADLTHQTATGFSTARVSTLRNSEGEVTAQWHIQTRDKPDPEEISQFMIDAFKHELSGLHKWTAPKSIAKNLRADQEAYILIGDHHLGMYAWEQETGQDDYDVEKSLNLLIDSIKTLFEAAPNCKRVVIVNLGDFFHADDHNSMTPKSKNLLDSDGRYGRVINRGIYLLRYCVDLGLDYFEEVYVMNARGNHDPTAALWLNEAMKAYYENNPRVHVYDNYNKLLWHSFGSNLVVVHHGDGLKRQQLYEGVTKVLREQWGRAKHSFCWTGHIHHRDAKEIGGMMFESWGVLPPVDAWAAGAMYCPERSISCVVLHHDKGEVVRFKVNV